MAFFNKALAAAAVLLGASVAASADELRVGTASMGGAFYPVGQAISNLVKKHVDGHTMVPVVTQGAVQNPRLVANGEVDIAITNASTGYFAYVGKAPYKEKLDIRSVGSLHPSVLHIVTLAGSKIKSIEDMKGASVAVGPAGGGTLALLRDLLSVHGMSMKDITPSFLSYADGFSQLSDGSVDVSVALAGYPTSAVMQTRATNEIAFIAISEKKLAETTQKFPYYSAVTVPADVYKTDGNVRLLGVNNILITSAKKSDDEVFAIAKAIYDHMDEFGAENANARQIVPKDSLKLAVPLHPGAKRYFDGRQ